MKPLTQIGAQYFVRKFGADASVNGSSVEDFLTTLTISKGSAVFSEGTQEFEQLKDCLLREAERSLLLSGNCYARALDNLRECSVYWSVVGLYYASFFSLKAVLGMHGCWMNRPNRWIEVVDANPGAQKLVYKTISYPNSGGKKGSHKVTWVAFYEAMNHLAAWLTSPYALLATNPVNANKTWMIDTRNDVNYDSLAAFQMMTEFQATFDPATIPTCFSGKLQTMYQVAQAFVQFSKEMALDLGLRTDVCDPAATRMDWCQQYVTSLQHPRLIAFAASEYLQLEY